MRPAKKKKKKKKNNKKISLGVRPVWSESSLCSQMVAKDPSFLHADSEDSDLSLRWAHSYFFFFFFFFFFHEAAQIRTVSLNYTRIIIRTHKTIIRFAGFERLMHNGENNWQHRDTLFVYCSENMSYVLTSWHIPQTFISLQYNKHTWMQLSLLKREVETYGIIFHINPRQV